VRLTGRYLARSRWEEFEFTDTSKLVWDHHAVPLSQFKIPEAGPNAPLLKRVIRYPISMEPEGPKREIVFDGSREDTKRPSHDRVPMVFRENAQARSAAGPMADVEHGPDPLPHPFGRAREAARARAEDRHQ
jgi:hypothetical protein